MTPARSATRVVLGWLAATGAAFGAVSPAPAPDAAQHALAALIAERSAELAITRKTGVTPADLGLQTANEIKAGRYAAAQRIAGQVLARSQQQGLRFYPFNEYMGSIVRGDDPSLLQHLNTWIEQEPTSAIGLLIRAMYFAETGRTARGTETAGKVPDALMKLFEEDMARSTSDLLTSVRLNPRIPWSYAELERVSSHAGNVKVARDTFQQGSLAFPDYYPLYRLRLNWLTPKWGGSINAMYGFVDQYAGAARPDSPLKMLYLDLYSDLLDAARFQCGGNRGRCFKDALGQSVRPGLREHVQQALSLYRVANPADFSAAAWPLLDAIACAPCSDTASTFGGSVLQMAADIMGSDNRMMDNSAHNSYMLDDITAHVWAQLGNPANADKKYREALTDVEHTAFSDPALKAQALATIYDHMTAFADNTGQFVDMIVYQDAANAVAGDNRSDTPWLKCYAYYRLKHPAEAVRECTSLIDGHGNYLVSHYWRAKAYEQLGEWDQSIADFAPVADSSDNWFRVGAALDMSYDFGQKHDYAGQLASMNQHGYLFDATMQPPRDLAAAFNNRCFAQMKLGHLREALDDCTKSLSYDRLPDAFHKQQELLKALGRPAVGADAPYPVASDFSPRAGKYWTAPVYALVFVALGGLAILVIRLNSRPPGGSSEDNIRRELASGEQLLWSSRPQQGLRLRAADAALIPFSLVWGGFAIFWEYGAATGFASGNTRAAPQFFAVWGIPFVVLGLYLIVGRFFVDAWVRSRTELGVTDRRIVILTRVFTAHVRSLALGSLAELALHEGRNGRGTITFGPNPSGNWAATPGWPGAGRRTAPTFEGIEQVRPVYELIQAAAESARQRSPG
jgi:tetratricopeptide (TPR) repeat protein